ncbi:hypothetical protein [Streptomyces sp. TRM68367]|uniref:hypothetical protein n=1 Tax=Streptomyces sp. TRM68367 TaxID=2758415 RepID=UPI00165A3EFA|nr:hypothetical protein [Streptomyces sp. TRM68367]MBC9729272.1 hypothetical protein [Streptomyces sp. TRM68367]
MILNDGNGRVAFTSSNKPLADSVSRSYPGSVVLPRGAAPTEAAPTEAAPTEA